MKNLFICFTTLSSSLLNASSIELSCPNHLVAPIQRILTVPISKAAIDKATQNASLVNNGEIKEQLKNLPTSAQSITCADVQKVANVFQGIEEVFGKTLSYTKRLNLNLLPMDNNAFIEGTQLAVLPKNMEIHDVFKNPSFMVPMWAHEFGHSIFALEMVKLNPSWKEALDLQNESTEKEIAMGILFVNNKDIFLDQNFDMNKITNPDLLARVEELLTNWGKLNEEFRELDEKVEATEYFTYKNLMHPHNEFFADLIAVLYTNDGAALYKSMSRTKLIQNHEEKNIILSAQLRDFTRRENELSRWTKFISRLDEKTKRYVTEGHTLLAPVRYHIWSNYIKGETSQMRKLVIIKNVLTAINIQLHNLYNAGNMSPDPVQINKELITLIDQEFNVQSK